ncbi:hypothetical protein [Alienimonas sp. DA493]|uniref:hypothetical protein n=1 Tax=Alienimonas sp. DA493 TaxID=3373605 RepID=UPI0037543156
MSDPPAIAPGPPPPDPLRKIDPAREPDQSGCYPGCCGLACALWAAPALAVTALFAGEVGGAALGWAFLFLGELSVGVAGAWAALKWLTGPVARRRAGLAAVVAAVLFGAGAIGGFVASERAQAAAPPDAFLAGAFEMLVAITCLPPAAGGAALALGTVIFTEPDPTKPLDASSDDPAPA